jgi:excisionase family DNA binding protein
MGRQISVSEAAERLGVTPHRVRQRIQNGSLPAERVGHRWGIDEADLLPLLEKGRAGRPLSERSAWALVDHADPSPAARAALSLLAPSERQRTEERWSSITSHVQGTDDVAGFARLLREMLSGRAERQVLRANNRDLPDLRADTRLALSGVSDPRAGIAAGDIVEGYVARGHLEQVVRDYLLAPAVGRSQRQRANVVLHSSSRTVDPPPPLLLVAADLADHRTPREESRAAEILDELTAADRVRHETGGDR